MPLHAHSNVTPLWRHDLVTLHPASWISITNEHASLRSEPLVSEWRRRGWPLISRRSEPGERAGIPVGLPLPPSAGKRRLSFVVQDYQVIAVDRPPTLNAADRHVPDGWLPTLWALRVLATRHDVKARVFGGLGWSVITGLDYLTPSSDLDFLLYLRRDTDIASLLDDLAFVQASAPMRMDGELIRSDGAAVNWKELHAAKGDVLVKSMSGASLCTPMTFLHGGVAS